MVRAAFRTKRSGNKENPDQVTGRGFYLVLHGVSKEYGNADLIGCISVSAVTAADSSAFAAGHLEKRNAARPRTWQIVAAGRILNVVKRVLYHSRWPRGALATRGLRHRITD